MNDKNDTEKVRTACPAHCGIDCCGILAHVKNDKVVKLEPGAFPDHRDDRICLRGLSSVDLLYYPDRIKYPMKRTGERGEGKFERVSWEEAFSTVATNFRETAKEYDWKSIGYVLGGPGAGTTKFGAYLRLASLTKSTRVSAWGYGDAGLPCGSRIIFGSHLPYIYLFGKFWQRKWPDLLIVWGANPGESQPLQSMRKILDAKEAGTKLVVVDPRFTVTASKADKYVGLKPGTDAALALGIMNQIFHKNLHAADFIRENTNGPYLVRTDNEKFLRGEDVGERKKKEYVVWHEKSEGPKTVRRSTVKKASLTGTFDVNGFKCKPAFQMLIDMAEQYTLDKTERVTGVSADLITELAEKIAKAKDVTFFTNMGFTRTYHGDLSLRAMATLASVTGNVAASFSSGYMPAVLNWDPFLNAKPDEPSYERLGILNLYDAVTEGTPYPIKAIWFAFINFVNQCANSNKIIQEIFPKLDFIVISDMFMTPTARYADLILPVCSFLEFSDFLPHPYPYLQLQQKIIEPLYESKSDVDIVAGVAKKLGYGEYFEGGEEAFIDLILDHPSLSYVNREKLKDGPCYLKEIPEGTEVPMTFGTPSGKIEIYAESLIEEGQALPVYLEPYEAPIGKNEYRYPLTFVQGHSRFRTHSMYANVDSLLKLNPEPEVEINPKDAHSRGIINGDMVTVYNDRAQTILKAKVTKAVRQGVVNITEGWWFEQFKEGSVNHLTHDEINPVQDKVYEPNMHMNDVAVEVKKYGGDNQ